MAEKIFIGVAWPYASGSRHLGHVAGFGIPCDVFARYHRLVGNDVLMVSGTDEHGTPVTVRAEREGKAPAVLADHYNREIAANLLELGISYDLFTRTITPNHYRLVQELFLAHYEKGTVFSDTMQGTYCEHCQRFLPDRYVEGSCPYCGYEDARGDQCDECGRQLDPEELLAPRCKICGHPAATKETEHFFLDLPTFSDRLRQYVLRHQDHWRPNVLNFSLGLLNEGLKPRPITRDLEWGVPIPLEGYGDKRIYVWFDAVAGYYTASHEWAQRTGDSERWREWWQNPQSRHYYFMGKDNIVFHSIIWPSMLMGYDESLQLPYDVVSSEFLTMEGKQFSTSRGVAVWLPDFLSRYDPDPLRFYLTINGPEARDTDFSWAEFVRRNNDELVATWGNLAYRVLSMTQRYFEGVVPDPGELDEQDQALLEQVRAGFGQVGELLAQCKFKAAILQGMAIAHEGNRYLELCEPWKTAKKDRQRTATTLFVALRLVDSLKTLFCPFMPHTSQQLHRLLGYPGTIVGELEMEETDYEGRAHRFYRWNPGAWEGCWAPSELPAGQQLRPAQPLFSKLDDSVVEQELARMRQQIDVS
ncbi:MAG: methionine--tRNA ligase [Chloroflexia bacterium]|nr:methionine--tRNA ligase [Chloroflexia bacterium]